MSISSSASRRVGTTVAAKYVLERQLGEGGMGSVFLAHHALTGRRVALKWVPVEDETSRERVLREARAMGRLAHPNVVGVLDVGEEEGAIFMVLEYVHGQNLRRYAAGRRLSPAAALDLLMPALSGVAAAHQAGILHRDLKPENLFVCLDADDTPFDTKVLDFGVSKQIAEPDEVSLTQSGAIVGTPRYMAPEQIAAEPSLTPAADIYALSLILYELLTGELPYAATSLRGLALEILRGAIASPATLVPELPEELCRVVLKALANDAPNRFQDVAAFAKALEPWAGQRRFERPREAHTPQPGMASEAITEAGLARARAAAGATVRDAGSPDATSGVRGAPTEPRGKAIVRKQASSPHVKAPANGEASGATRGVGAAAVQALPVSTAGSALPTPSRAWRMWAVLLLGLGVLAGAWLVLGSQADDTDAAQRTTRAETPKDQERPAHAAGRDPANVPNRQPESHLVAPPGAIAEPTAAEAAASAQPEATEPETTASGSARRERARLRTSKSTPPPSAPVAAPSPKGSVEGRSGTFRREDF